VKALLYGTTTVALSDSQNLDHLRREVGDALQSTAEAWVELTDRDGTTWSLLIKTGIPVALTDTAGSTPPPLPRAVRGATVPQIGGF